MQGVRVRFGGGVEQGAGRVIGQDGGLEERAVAGDDPLVIGRGAVPFQNGKSGLRAVDDAHVEAAAVREDAFVLPPEDLPLDERGLVLHACPHERGDRGHGVLGEDAAVAVVRELVFAVVLEVVGRGHAFEVAGDPPIQAGEVAGSGFHVVHRLALLRVAVLGGFKRGPQRSHHVPIAAHQAGILLQALGDAVDHGVGLDQRVDVIVAFAVLADPPDVAALFRIVERPVVSHPQSHRALPIALRQRIFADAFHHLRHAEKRLVGLPVHQRVLPAGTDGVVAGVAELVVPVAVAEGLDEAVVVEVAGDEMVHRFEQHGLVGADELRVAGGEKIVGRGVEYSRIGVGGDVPFLQHVIERAVVVHAMVQPELDGAFGDLVEVDAHHRGPVAHPGKPLEIAIHVARHGVGDDVISEDAAGRPEPAGAVLERHHVRRDLQQGDQPAPNLRPLGIRERSVRLLQPRRGEDDGSLANGPVQDRDPQVDAFVLPTARESAVEPFVLAVVAQSELPHVQRTDDERRLDGPALAPLLGQDRRAHRPRVEGDEQLHFGQVRAIRCEAHAQVLPVEPHHPFRTHARGGAERIFHPPRCEFTRRDDV
jgi:hypothetical protein